MKITIKTVALSALILGFTGCGQPKPMNIESLRLDTIKPIEAIQKLDKTIIVLNPIVKIISTNNTSSVASRIRALANMKYGRNYNFNEVYNREYNSISNDALKSDIVDILSNQGFNINNDFESYDDIDFSLRKSAYLIIQPETSIYFQTSNVNADKVGNKITETGTVAVNGTITIKILESLSKEKISSKKIELSKLNLKKTFVSVRKLSGSFSSAFGAGQALGNAIGGALFSSSKQDNTKNTLITILNDMHAKATIKIKSRLQKEILLSYVNDIKEIKSKKVY